ncbi:MAG: Zn-ribbon domain-containing OB-fold protein [Thermoprotei archaeon]
MSAQQKVEKKKTQKEQTEEVTKQFNEFVESIKKSTGLPIVPDMKSGAAQWIDQRELTLKYVISVDKIRKFFDGLIDGKLYATKCKQCGTLYFPPQVDCPKCRKSDMEWIELSNEGELLTYTIINVKPNSFSHYDDYTVGIARLKEGINITAWVRETDPKKLRVGMKVKVIVTKREPEGYLTYELEPLTS